MKFLTDFADQAVVLPLVVAVALVLVFQGWRRGACAWLVTIGTTFSVVLALKLIFLSCTAVFGPIGLRSPSGHAAAAAAVCGSLAVIYGGSVRGVLVTAVLAWVAIGLTRIGLHAHSWPEVVLGGGIGLAGAVGMVRLAGAAPGLRLRPMVLAATFVVALFHGRHLAAEIAIQDAASNLGWLPALCQGSGRNF